MLFGKSKIKKSLSIIIPLVLLIAVCLSGCESKPEVSIAVEKDALSEMQNKGLQGIPVEDKTQDETNAEESVGKAPEVSDAEEDAVAETEAEEEGSTETEEESTGDGSSEEDTTGEETIEEETNEIETAGTEPAKTEVTPGSIENVVLDPGWEYAGHTKINSGAAKLYRAAENRKNIVIGVNAGHGTKGGQSVKTYCHPDMSPKVTGGTTASGSVTAVAVSGGMTFADGAKEAQVALETSKILRDKLLAQGYDVLMLRDDTDVQLDNVARTVIANNVANCIISLHWDGDNLGYDKGCFYISTPDGIKNMEPVSQHWQEHERLGAALIEGLKSKGCKINGNGKMSIDLTQTSYSTIPSIDIELGNQASAHDAATLSVLADGLLGGIGSFFGTN